MLKSRYCLSVISFFLFFLNPCFAETQLGLRAFTVTPNSKIEITSNSMIFNSKTNMTEFVDDVVVNYGKFTLKALSLSILQPTDSLGKNPLVFSAKGPLEISNGENFIYGDSAFYSGNDQELTVSGNVNLINGNNKIFGEKLILSLNNGLAKISGSVKTILGPIEGD